MTNITNQELKSAKNIVGPLPATQTNTKLIDCPEHPGQHKAVMDVFPSDTAGYWQCPEGAEDYHDCVDSAAEGKSELEVESSQVDYWPTPDIDSSYERSFYVCAGDEGCGRAIDLDVADPAEDMADRYEDD